MLKQLNKSIERRILGWIDIDRYLPIQLDITNACNLRCKHCYHPHHQNEGALDLADWISLLDQYDALIRHLGFRPYVILCGGEPFLSKHFEPLLRDMARRWPNYRVSVLTNGTIPDREKIKLLAQIREVSVQVSIDGPTEASHDATRGTGSFSRAVGGIAEFQRHGIPVTLLAILSKRTAPAIGEFFTLAQSLGVSGMGFTRLIEEGQAKNLVAGKVDRALQPLELREAYRSMIRESARTSVRTSTSAPLFNLVYPGLGRNGRFGEGIVIDYKGNYLASSRSRLVLGNASRDGLENIFLNHPLLQRLRKRDVKVCGNCPHFNVCGGDRNAAYAHSGDFLGADPGCWVSIQQPKTA